MQAKDFAEGLTLDNMSKKATRSLYERNARQPDAWDALGKEAGKRLGMFDSSVTRGPADRIAPTDKAGSSANLAQAIERRNSPEMATRVANERKLIDGMTKEYDKHPKLIKAAAAAKGINPEYVDQYMQDIRHVPDAGEFRTGREWAAIDPERFGDLADKPDGTLGGDEYANGNTLYRQIQPGEDCTGQYRQLSPQETEGMQSGTQIQDHYQNLDKNAFYRPDEQGIWQADDNLVSGQSLVEQGLLPEGADSTAIFQKGPDGSFNPLAADEGKNILAGGDLQSKIRGLKPTDVFKVGQDGSFNPVEGVSTGQGLIDANPGQLDHFKPTAFFEQAGVNDIVQATPDQVGQAAQGLDTLEGGASGEIPFIGSVMDAGRGIEKDFKKIDKDKQKDFEKAQAKDNQIESSLGKAGAEAKAGLKKTKSVTDNVGAALATEGEILIADAALPGSGEIVRSIPGARSLLFQANKLIIGIITAILGIVIGATLLISVGMFAFIGITMSRLYNTVGEPLVDKFTTMLTARMETEAEFRMLAYERMEFLIAEGRIPADYESIVQTAMAADGTAEDEDRRIAEALSMDYLGLFDPAYAAVGTTSARKVSYNYLDGYTLRPTITEYSGAAGWVKFLQDIVKLGQDLLAFVDSPAYAQYLTEQEREEVRGLAGMLSSAYASGEGQERVKLLNSYNDANNPTIASTQEAFAQCNWEVKLGNITIEVNQRTIDALKKLLDIGGDLPLGIGDEIKKQYDLAVALEVLSALEQAKAGCAPMETHEAMYEAIKGEDENNTSLLETLLPAALANGGEEQGPYSGIFTDGLGEVYGSIVGQFENDPQATAWQTDFMIGQGQTACEAIKAAGKYEENLYWQVHCENLGYTDMMYAAPLKNPADTELCAGGFKDAFRFQGDYKDYLNYAAADTGVYTPLLAAFLIVENEGNPEAHLPSCNLDVSTHTCSSTQGEGCAACSDTECGVIPLTYDSWNSVVDRVKLAPHRSLLAEEEASICRDEENIFGFGFFAADRLQNCNTENNPDTGSPWCTAEETKPNNKPSEAQMLYLAHHYYGNCDAEDYTINIPMEDGSGCTGTYDSTTHMCTLTKSYCDLIVEVTHMMENEGGEGSNQVTCTGWGGLALDGSDIDAINNWHPLTDTNGCVGTCINVPLDQEPLMCASWTTGMPSSCCESAAGGTYEDYCQGWCGAGAMMFQTMLTGTNIRLSSHEYVDNPSCFQSGDLVRWQGPECGHLNVVRGCGDCSNGIQRCELADGNWANKVKASSVVDIRYEDIENHGGVGWDATYLYRSQ
ncbi:MAG TPA: hypothetical protein PKL83_00165 [bacterium]|nr:hypothetical protein [bacterium]